MASFGTSGLAEAQMRNVGRERKTERRGKKERGSVVILSDKCDFVGWGKEQPTTCYKFTCGSFILLRPHRGGLEGHLTRSNLQLVLQFSMHACTAGRL